MGELGSKWWQVAGEVSYTNAKEHVGNCMKWTAGMAWQYRVLVLLGEQQAHCWPEQSQLSRQPVVVRVT